MVKKEGASLSQVVMTVNTLRSCALGITVDVELREGSVPGTTGRGRARPGGRGVAAVPIILRPQNVFPTHT